MNSSNTELHLLETLYSKQGDSLPTSQRELAGAAGLSLGMTNALLRRFIERGWIKLLRLSGRSLRYVLTPEGAEEVLSRTLSYFTRAVRSASLYRNRIDAYVIGLAEAGYSTIVLEGPAELDFLFDYSCERHGLQFVKNPSGIKREALAALPGVMFVAAETAANLDAGCVETDGQDKSEPPLVGASYSRLADILFACVEPLIDSER